MQELPPGPFPCQTPGGQDANVSKDGEPGPARLGPAAPNPLPSSCDLPGLFLVRTSGAGSGTSVTKTRTGCFSKGAIW